MVTLLKRWDGSAYQWVKSVQYRSGAAWSKIVAPRVRVNGIWKPVETRQPAVLIGDGYETRALWHFDTGSGDVCYDSSGHGIHIDKAYYAEQPAWASGYFYNALRFTDDRISTTTPGSLYYFTNGDTWQVDVVFKLTGSAPSENKVFIGYYGGASNVWWLGTVATTGYLRTYVRDAAGNSDSMNGTTNVYDNTWHKASFVRIGGIIKLYLDGNLQASKDDNNTAGYNLARMNIGWFDTGTFPEYAIDDGYICEIRIIKGGTAISSLTGEHVTQYTFTEIGSTTDVFFWALREFSGKLYAGTYLESPPSVYNYSPWTHLKDFSAAGESLTQLTVFNNELYASTEKTGQIYKMNTANPTSWSVVHDDAYIYALDLIVFGGYLYAQLTDISRNTKILRSANGSSWSTVASFSGKYLRHFAIYNNELYAMGRVWSTGKVWAEKTANGTTWSSVSNLNTDTTGQYYYALEKDGYLWVPMGERSDGKANIYKYNGSSLVQVLSLSYPVFHRAAIFDNKLWFTVGPAWKAAGTSALYMSPTGEDGTWTHVNTWSGKSNARALATFSNKLYIGISNKVYRMEEA